MSKRYLVMTAFFAGIVFGIAGLTWIGANGSSTAMAVPAPESKPSADWISVREYGPERKTPLPNANNPNDPVERIFALGVKAYREQTGQQTAIYGIELAQSARERNVGGGGRGTARIETDEETGNLQISLEEAEKLLAFCLKYKDKTKSKAKEIARATVRFSTKSLKGSKLEFEFDLDSQQFRRFTPSRQYSPTFFDDLAAAINDAKAMKKIPFSVTPE